jgi:hypothetical protein
MDVWTANVIGQNNGLFKPEYYTNVTTVEVIDGENVTVNYYSTSPTGMSGPAEPAPKNYIRVYSCCFGDLDNPVNSTIYPGEDFTLYCDKELYPKNVLIYDQDGAGVPDKSGTSGDSSGSFTSLDTGTVAIIVVVVVVVAIVVIGVAIARKTRSKEGQLLKNTAFGPEIPASDNSSCASERSSSITMDGRQSTSTFGRGTIGTNNTGRITDGSLNSDPRKSVHKAGDESQFDAL